MFLECRPDLTFDPILSVIEPFLWHAEHPEAVTRRVRLPRAVSRITRRG